MRERLDREKREDILGFCKVDVAEEDFGERIVMVVVFVVFNVGFCEEREFMFGVLDGDVELVVKLDGVEEDEERERAVLR